MHQSYRYTVCEHETAKPERTLSTSDPPGVMTCRAAQRVLSLIALSGIDI